MSPGESKFECFTAKIVILAIKIIFCTPESHTINTKLSKTGPQLKLLSFFQYLRKSAFFSVIS